MEEASVLAALGVVVSASVFTNGFLSLRIHAERSRALDSAERFDERCADILAGGESAISDSDLRKAGDVFAFGGVIPWAIAAGNLIPLGLTFWLIWISDDVTAPLLSVLTVEVLVVLLGFVDVWLVQSDLGQRKAKSYASRLIGVEEMLERGDNLDAEILAGQLAAQLPRAPWPLRLLGIARNETQKWAEASQALDRAMEVSGSLPVPETDPVALAARARSAEGLADAAGSVRFLQQALAAQDAFEHLKAIRRVGPEGCSPWEAAIRLLVESEDWMSVERALDVVLLEPLALGEPQPWIGDAIERFISGLLAETNRPYRARAELAISRWRRAQQDVEALDGAFDEAEKCLQ